MSDLAFILLMATAGAVTFIVLAKAICNEQNSSDCTGVPSGDEAAGCGGAIFPDQLCGESVASNFRESE